MMLGDIRMGGADASSWCLSEGSCCLRRGDCWGLERIGLFF